MQASIMLFVFFVDHDAIWRYICVLRRLARVRWTKTSRLSSFEVCRNEAWRSDDDLSWWPCCATNMLCRGWGLPAVVFTKDTAEREKKRKIFLKKQEKNSENGERERERAHKRKFVPFRRSEERRAETSVTPFFFA